MNKVLICKDESKIEAGKRFISEVTPHLQAVYDGFRTIGITVTVVQIASLQKTLPVKSVQRCDKNQFGQPDPTTRHFEQICDLSDTVRGLLVGTMDVPILGGLKLNKEKLMEMVELPDLSNLEKVFVDFSLFVSGTHNGSLRPDMFEVVNDKVQPVANANELMVNLFSHYATTTKQIELFEQLTKTSAAMNEWCEYMNSAGYVSDTRSKLEYPQIDGLSVKGGVFMPDYLYIQSK